MYVQQLWLEFSKYFKNYCDGNLNVINKKIEGNYIIIVNIYVYRPHFDNPDFYEKDK